MLINISPHRKSLINGRYQKNPVSNHQDFITLSGVLSTDKYVINPVSEIATISGLNGNLIKQIFPKTTEKKSYAIKLSDNNNSLPEPVLFQGIQYEPILIKLRGLEDTLPAINDIINSKIFQKIKLSLSSLPINSSQRRKIEDEIWEYNQDQLIIIKEEDEKYMDIAAEINSPFVWGY